MTAKEEIAQLREELAKAHALNAQLEAELEGLRKQLAELTTKGDNLPPSFVKPSTPKKERVDKQPRRKRAKEQNGARRREQMPTRIVEHRLEECPDCGYGLRHSRLSGRRQVIELPPPPPVEVTEHQLFKGWCARCCKWHYATVDLQGQVLGQGRMGVRIAALVAHLRTTLRIPVPLIKEYLHTLHNLTISSGGIVGLLHQVAQAAPLKGAYTTLKEKVRGSRVVHADETGWREEGQNGYVWSFSTPEGERLYEYDRSRAGAVARRILGSNFGGVLCTDFYCGYNDFPGEHQRCWVHLLRDIHKLKEEHPDENKPVDKEVLAWAGEVRELYDDARKLLAEHQLGPPTLQEEVSSPERGEQREKEYGRLVAQAVRVGRQYANAKEHRQHPCHALCKRLLRHQDELFQFVLVPGLSSDNNLAERSVRPVVVTRKVSGGTQSPKGSTTRMILSSLFGTWRAKGLNPFDQCLALLSQTTPLLPQI